VPEPPLLQVGVAEVGVDEEVDEVVAGVAGERVGHSARSIE